jgi:hypothetical protein
LLAVFNAAMGRLLMVRPIRGVVGGDTKTSGRDAARSVKRAKVLEALPELGDALGGG